MCNVFMQGPVLMSQSKQLDKAGWVSNLYDQSKALQNSDECQVSNFGECLFTGGSDCWGF